MFKKHKVLKTIREVPFRDYFSIKEVLVEAPNKAQTHFFIRQAEDFSIAIPFLDEKTVVMVRQHRVGSDQISLEFPMGVATKHTALQMAQLELEEETGYTASKFKEIGSFFPTSSSSPQAGHVFVATGLNQTGKRNLEPTEHIEVEAVSYEELRRLVREGGITDGATIAAFGLFLNLHGNNALNMRGLL